MADRLVDPDANAKRIENVEKCFFGSLTQPLVVPNRILVGEGVLTKMCRKKPKARQFFLFDDLLVYGTIVIARKKGFVIDQFEFIVSEYNSMHVIDLADVKLQSLDDDGALKNGWQIISPKKSFSVYAATGQEKVEWMAHINRCVQDLIVKRGLAPAPSDDSPVWIPDSEANKCMVCKKSEFTVLNRKHHCRKCGRVVCNPCSTKRWLLPSQSAKPQRVCDACFDKLNRAGGDSTDDATSPYISMSPAAAVETSDDSSSDDDEAAPQNTTPIAPGSNNNQQDMEPQFYETGAADSNVAVDNATTAAATNSCSNNDDVTNDLCGPAAVTSGATTTESAEATDAPATATEGEQ